LYIVVYLCSNKLLSCAKFIATMYPFLELWWESNLQFYTDSSAWLTAEQPPEDRKRTASLTWTLGINIRLKCDRGFKVCCNVESLHFVVSNWAKLICTKL
jgi:hypothetical protein